MADFLQLAFAGLALGSIYALIALGFTIIFKASGVINFAQGEFLLVGAYIVSAGMNEYKLDFYTSLLIAIVVTVLIGVLFERFVLRRMVGRPVFSILMITIGLDILIRTIIVVRVGPDFPPAGSPFVAGSKFQPGGVTLLFNDLWAILIAALCCGALYLFFRHTKYGLAMRATAIDQEAALAMGINLRLVYALAWGIAAAIAVLGGIFLAIKSFTVDPVILSAQALRAFPAIILGGVDSIPGAVVGGVLIGLTEVLVAGYEGPLEGIFGTNLYTIAPYILMIVVLLFRPYGLFGTRKVERI